MSAPITNLLQEASGGSIHAQDRLLDAVYGELRRLADARMKLLSPGQTVQATALVHDAWIRLGIGPGSTWESRAHFFGAAANAMRNILVEQARRKSSAKRGGAHRREELPSQVAAPAGLDRVDVLALDMALERLEREFPRPSRVVMLRYFAGVSHEDIARMLDVSVRTVEREWLFSRTWLRRELGTSA